MKRTKILIVGAALSASLSILALAQDPGWPRKNVQPQGTVISYQPQVDDWKDFRDIAWRRHFN